MRKTFVQVIITVRIQPKENVFLIVYDKDEVNFPPEIRQYGSVFKKIKEVSPLGNDISTGEGHYSLSSSAPTRNRLA